VGDVIYLAGRKEDLEDMRSALETSYTFLEAAQEEIDTVLEAVDRLQETYDFHMRAYVSRVGLDNVEIGFLEYVGDLQLEEEL
jgi:division protein CdvB (Snf7/Vps24/ESCRT-III family)